MSPSSVPTFASTSQTHEDDCSTLNHNHHLKIAVSENKEYQTILIYQKQLINAISTNTLSIAVALQEHEFISDEISGKTLRPSSSPQEKATILVSAVREKIKTAPKRFPELIRVFSEQVTTTDIAEKLQSAYRDKGKSSFSRELVLWLQS